MTKIEKEKIIEDIFSPFVERGQIPITIALAICSKLKKALLEESTEPEES